MIKEFIGFILPIFQKKATDVVEDIMIDSAIKSRIINFNREYDNTVIDTNTFEVYLNHIENDKKLYCYFINKDSNPHLKRDKLISELVDEGTNYVYKRYDTIEKDSINDFVNDYIEALVGNLESYTGQQLTNQEAIKESRIVRQTTAAVEDCIQETLVKLNEVKSNQTVLYADMSDDQKQLVKNELELSYNDILNEQLKHYDKDTFSENLSNRLFKCNGFIDSIRVSIDTRLEYMIKPILQEILNVYHNHHVKYGYMPTEYEEIIVKGIIDSLGYRLWESLVWEASEDAAKVHERDRGPIMPYKQKEHDKETQSYLSNNNEIERLMNKLYDKAKNKTHLSVSNLLSSNK